MKGSWLLSAVAIAAMAAVANAGLVVENVSVADPSTLTITDQSWQDLGMEGDVALGEWMLSEKVQGTPATLNGQFTCDGDPMVWVRKDVENDTGFAWTAYAIEVHMPQSFSIIGVEAPIVGGYAWNYAATTPSLVGSAYVATVSYWMLNSNPIINGDFGDFGIRLQFDGTVQFCVIQTPTPEPVSLMLLAVGGLMLARKRA